MDGAAAGDTVATETVAVFGPGTTDPDNAESGGPESGGPESGGPEAGGPESGGTESGALFDVDVPVRLPSALSPSRAGDFMQCPLLFRLRVVDKVPEPP